MITAILIFITILLFAAWNGYVIQWKLTGKAIWSRRWHAVAFIVKMPLVAVVWINSTWWMAIIAGFLSWVIYNIIIALIMGKKWYYIGNSAWFDIQVRKLLSFVDFDKS